ncbi:hypothetical protein FOC1_g10000106 [Fusarium oxysporum f. sp. cubense race 1]|uniref:AC9 transposase n=1 Tax=Fusarium oxysporum f. sp. cubense (strain race 1) TaxID=1229664 RepID=N4U0N2_FUSC1|nr:hypothetical protein FOC1_g10000106 [Fusarium oxysporum f. sp. cubense race 1]
MRHITANFSIYQDQLKAKLQSAVPKIHISSDLWTSPHRHGVLAVCARWVDEDYQPRRALLSLPEIRHSHSGEHQSQIIFSTLDIYEIANQLGCHTGDNAAPNDTCLQHLSTRLRQDRNVRRTPALFSLSSRLIYSRSTGIQNGTVSDVSYGSSDGASWRRCMQKNFHSEGKSSTEIR